MSGEPERERLLGPDPDGDDGGSLSSPPEDVARSTPRPAGDDARAEEDQDLASDERGTEFVERPVEELGMDFSGLGSGLDVDDEEVIDLAGSGSAVDIPVPAAPENDRFAKLATAAQTMRQAVREEVQAGANQIFQLALEQARAELDLEISRFEDEIHRELETFREQLGRRTADERIGAMSIESQLEEMAEVLRETRDAVLRLQARYLPGAARED